MKSEKTKNNYQSFILFNYQSSSVTKFIKHQASLVRGGFKKNSQGLAYGRTWVVGSEGPIDLTGLKLPPSYGPLKVKTTSHNLLYGPNFRQGLAKSLLF